MKTVTVQIGNSDDKLTQSEWNVFVRTVKNTIEHHASGIYFFGAPPNYESWQNACWVFECDERSAQQLRTEITNIRFAYKQTSIAWTEGETIFI